MGHAARAIRRGIQATRGRALYGLRNFTGTNYYGSANPGGEPGSASGFTAVFVFKLDSWPTATNSFCGRTNNANQGWTAYLTSAGVLAVAVAGGGGAFTTVTRTLSASDLGRVHVVTLQHTGPGGTVRMTVDRYAPAAGAISGMTPWSGPSFLGALYTGSGVSLPATSITLLGEATFFGVPTNTQIDAYVDEVRRQGDLPRVMPGFTLYGARDFSAANYLRAPTAGIRGAASGFTVFADFTLNALAPASGRIYSSYTDAVSAGCSLYLDNGPSLGFYAFGGPALNLRAFTTVDLGQRFTGAVTWDGTTWTPYFDGVAGTPVVGGFARNTTTPMWVGYGPDNTPASIITLWGIAGCDQALSAAEVAQVHAAVRATGVLDLPSGKINPHVYDLNRAITANGGHSFGVPAQVLDYAGGEQLTRVGAPAVVVQGGVPAHRWSARDSLINVTTLAGRTAYGARNFSSGNGYATAVGAGVRGSTSGFWLALTPRYDVSPSAGSYMVACATDGTNGWYLQVINGNLIWTVRNTTPANVVTPSIALLATDVGITEPILLHYTGSALRIYRKRTQQGADAAAGTYAPATSVMQIGQFNGTQGATFLSVFEAMGGNGNPSLAQVQQVFDDFESTGRLQPIGGGLTEHLWSFGDTSGVPVQVLDRIGSDHFIRPPGMSVAIMGSARGVVGYSQAHYLTTVAPGGVAGTASGFWFGAMVMFKAHRAAGARTLASRGNVSSAGWYLMQWGGSNDVVAVIADGGGVRRSVGGPAVSNAELNTRVFHYSFFYDGTTLHFLVDGVEVSSLPVTGYTALAAAAATTFGVSNAGGTYASDEGIVTFGGGGGHFIPTAGELATAAAASLASGRFTAIPAKTDKLWDFTQDMVESGNVLPSVFKERVSGVDHLTRVGTSMELARSVEIGPTAPLALVDTVTGAAADVLTRVGTPLAVTIDPSTDGRKTYGALGFTATARLESAIGAGLRGATTGFHIRLHITFWSLAGQEYPASCASSSATTGWAFYRNVAALTVLCGNGTAGASTRTLTSADIGVPHLVELVYTGLQVELRFDGAPSAAASCTFAEASATLSMVIGSLTAGGWPAPTTTIWGLSGANVIPTLADSVAAFETFKQTGKLPVAAGAGAHYYDLTADIAANGGPELGVPAQVLDRIGSDHLRRGGGQSVVISDTARGVDGFDSEHLFRTATGGGIAGAVTGFWAGCYILSKAFVNYPRIPMGRSTLGGVGWYFMVSNLGGANAAVTISNGTTMSTIGSFVLTHGQRYHLSFVLEADGTVTFYVDGVSRGSGTIPNYAASTLATYFGTCNGATYVFTDGVIFGGGGGHAVPTPTEIAASAAATHAAGAFVGVPSKTDCEWDLRQDIEAAGGGVPPFAVERISGADHMTRTGAPLQVAQRAERVWSHEAAPIMYAADGLASNAHFSRAPGFGGHAAGWWWNLVFRVTSQNVPSRARALLACYPGGAGFALYSYTSNNTLQAVFCNAAGVAAAAPTIIIAPADVGKVLSIYGVADVVAGRAKLYQKRLDQTGGVMAGYKPAVGYPFRLGDVTVSDASEGIQILGYQHGLGIPMFSQVAANYDASMAGEDVVAMPGMTTSLYSLTRSIRENGGTMPATILDRVGSEHLTTVGNPIVAPLYARAWGY
jgi:hypothetical protein